MMWMVADYKRCCLFCFGLLFLEYARLKVLLDYEILPSLGHDRHCSETDILGALDVAASRGVRCHVTHLFNVTSFHHRKPSLVNFGMVGGWMDGCMCICCLFCFFVFVCACPLSFYSDLH